MVEAEIIAKKARKTLNTSAGKRTSTSAGKRTANNKSPHPKTALQEPAETAPLSIYREGTDRSRPSWQGSEGNPPPAHAPIGHNAGPPLAPEPELTGLMEWTTPILTEIPYTDELRRLYAEAVPADNDLSIPEFLRRTVQ
jgi:hypothetical protein